MVVEAPDHWHDFARCHGHAEIGVADELRALVAYQRRYLSRVMVRP